MSGYGRIFSSILYSTVWEEPNHVRIVWITMLAMANGDGVVEASLPGLAHAARVPLSEATDAVRRFLAPDPLSSTKTDGGRRIREVHGGWRLVNFEVYRVRASEAGRKERDRDRKRRLRAAQENSNDSAIVSACPPSSASVHDFHQPEPEPEPEPEPNTKQQRSLALEVQAVSADPARRVFDAWLAARAKHVKNGSTPRWTPDRQKAVRRALKSYSVDELCLAVEGIWAVEWNVRENRTDISLALRDAEHIEAFIAAAPRKYPKQVKPAESQPDVSAGATIDQREVDAEISRIDAMMADPDRAMR